VDGDDHRRRSQIDGLAAEVLGDLKGLGAFVWGALQLHEAELPGDGVVGGVLEAMNHVDQLGDLLDDLLEAIRVAADANGHPRVARIAAAGDDEGIDVESAPGEDLADPHEDAGLIVDEDREGVTGTRRDGCLWGVGSDDGGHGEK